MRLPHRILCCFFTLLFLSLLLFYRSSDSIVEPCVHSTQANQSLHRAVNTLPLDNFILHEPSLDKGRNYSLIVLVISAHYEREERRQIRQLWAAPDQSNTIKSGESRVIFVVGRSQRNEEEALSHGDLLEIDLPETYRNMVYKIETAFRWAKERTHSQFVAKIDSDTVVHVDRLLEQMKRQARERSDPWLACFHFPHSPPIRDTCSAWYISENDYPLDSFPTYCNGPGYVMERRGFETIVEQMGKHKVIEVEDAFFTGIVSRDRVDLVCLDEVIVPQYTEYSMCDSTLGPSLSIVPTHYQFSPSKLARNLTAAWNSLKTPHCHNLLTRLFRYLSKTFNCS